MEMGSIFNIEIQELFQRSEKELIFKFPFDTERKYINQLFFNTGRSAISYLLKYCIDNNKKDKVILLPTFLCSSILTVVKQSGIKYKFYNVNEDFSLDLNDINKQVDKDTGFFFYIDYFGFSHNQKTCDFIKTLKEKGIIIIEDLTQSLFTKGKEQIGVGDYIVASIRKWGAFPDGAILATKEENYLPIYDIEDGYNEYSFNYVIAQLMKSEYLRDKKLDKNIYLNLVKKANKSLFSDYTIRKITDLSSVLISNLDYDTLCIKRKKNALYLYRKLKNIKGLTIPFDYNEDIVPFGFVILTNQRNRLFEYLIENDIYCNIHWKLPDEVLSYSKDLFRLSNEILTIPCDQRYGKNECNYIVEKVTAFFMEEQIK